MNTYKYLDPSLKSVISAICHHSNIQNLIFVGSFADYCNYDRFIIKPKDLDIICTSLSDFGQLTKIAQFEGPFEEVVYQHILPHKQYYFILFGIRVDVFLVNHMEDYQNIKTSAVNYYGHNIKINSVDEAMSMHYKAMQIFENPKDSVELYRLRKHSRRYSFYKMIKEKAL